MTARRPAGQLARRLRPLLALAALGAAAACRGSSDDAAAADPQPVVGVRTAVATRQPFTETSGAIGVVTPRAGHVASLGAPAAGRVSRVFVAVGQHVSKGDALVALDPVTFQAAAQSADAALTAAELAATRAQRLATEGVAPRRDAEQAVADLAKARADATTARREAQLATLRSPIDGIVTRLAAVLGGSADPAQPLVEIADPSALDVVLSVTPAVAGRVRVGALVSVSAGQSAGGDTIGVGRVADVAGTVDSATRSVAVRVTVAGGRRPLRIGETVYAQIALGGGSGEAITVPVEALVPEGDGFKVFVVDSAQIAHARPVSVGARTDRVATIAEGLAAGERVVTYGAFGVDDSVKVTTVPVSRAAPAASKAAP